MIKETLAAVGLGYLIDLLIGDPHWLYHPIRIVGNLISLLEKWLRALFPQTENNSSGGSNPICRIFDSSGCKIWAGSADVLSAFSDSCIERREYESI